MPVLENIRYNTIFMFKSYQACQTIVTYFRKNENSNVSLSGQARGFIYGRFIMKLYVDSNVTTNINDKYTLLLESKVSSTILEETEQWKKRSLNIIKFALFLHEMKGRFICQFAL